MKITLKKETNLKIDMEDLMNECINTIDCIKSRTKRGLCAPYYEHLSEVVQENLEFLYSIDFDFYDNGQEKIVVITNNLLVWCVENHYPQEYHDLINFFHKEEDYEED